MAAKCPRCTQSVYMAEEVLGAGKKWHKRCFTCRTCGKGLDSSTLGEHDGEIYCKACHGKQFGPKGFGYGIGAGALTETSGPSIVPERAPVAPGPATETYSKPSSNAGGSIAQRFAGSDVCPRCGKKAYAAERVLGAGASWHKLCFTCKQCNKSVESTTLNEHAGEIYCKGCYSKNFGPKGFGYGVGAGALAHAQ